VLYGNGFGVPRDYVAAHMWWSIAALQGREDARKNRDTIEKKMSPSQLEDAQKLAHEWVKKHRK